MKHPRILIVFDGEAWFVRRVRTIEHDLTNDEKVYHCDVPIGVASHSFAGAVREAELYLSGKGNRVGAKCDRCGEPIFLPNEFCDTCKGDAQ